MDFTKGALELLFDRLHRQQHQLIPNILRDAIDEYRMLLGELDREEKRKVNFIKSLLDYCHSERWVQARTQLEPAEEEYYRFFFRKLSKIDNMKKRSPLILYPDLPTDRSVRRGSSKSEPPNKSSRPSSYTNIVEKQERNGRADRPQSEIVTNFKKKAERVTDLSDLSSMSKIAQKFGEIYRNEWQDALDELEALRIYEKNAISCLLKIVLDAYKVCSIEADTQISKLEDAAQNIMLEGTTRHAEKIRGHRSYLIQYRKEIALICLERLQETFHRRYLPEIIRSVGVYQNIRSHGAVHRYTNHCVAICWAMSVQDPQMYVVDDRDRMGMFNKEVYDEYADKGQTVALYVWPPLKTHKGGKLLTKGVAQGR